MFGNRTPRGRFLGSRAANGKRGLVYAAFLAASGALVFVSATTTAASAAGALTSAQQSAVTAVQAQAGNMAPAQTPAQAAQQQAALMPTVQSAVNAGTTAVQQLLSTTATTNPSVAADILRLSTGVSGAGAGSSSPTTAGASVADALQRGRRQPVAHAASCYPATYSYEYLETAGVTLGEVNAYATSWCGSGTTHVISSPINGSTLTHSTEAYGPYCNTGISEPDGWVQYAAEAGSETGAELGVSYVFGCAGISSYWTEINIWASGATDNDNDFGATS